MSRPLPTKFDIVQEARFRRLPGRQFTCFIYGAEDVLFGDSSPPETSPHVGGPMGFRPLKRKPYEQRAYEAGREWALLRIRHNKGEFA